MTIKERAELRKAIDMLFDDEDDYTGGMLILCKLAGVRWPAGEAVAAGGPTFDPMRPSTWPEHFRAPTSQETKPDGQ